MSGNFPDVPGNRMALDRDGSVVYALDAANNAVQLSAANVVTLTDETDTGYPYSVFASGASVGKLVVIFPELRNLLGYYICLVGTAYPPGAVSAVEVSPNSTNGIDGTWQALQVSTAVLPMSPGYRSGIKAVNAGGVKAVRITGNGRDDLSSGCAINLHLYGAPLGNQVLDKLAIWHPTLNQRIPPGYLDWGDVPRSSSDDRLIRVKNLSATLTAMAPSLSFDALTDATPSVPGQHLVSLDGLSFGATAVLPNLGPGATSAIVTLRRVTPINATLSTWALRLIAAATSWV